MQSNNVELSVKIKGHPITEYFHNGDVFVEGRHGSEFEIEVINRNPFEVEAVISVDGRSIINGKEASATSDGYVIGANETSVIPGWKVNEEQAAAFIFAAKRDSYATQTTGSSSNNGVIGMMAYAAQNRRPTSPIRTTRAPLPNAFPMDGWGSGGTPTKSGILRSSFGVALNNTSAGGWGGGDIMSASLSCASPEATIGGAVGGGARSRGFAPLVTQSLGTGFGDATEFQTVQTSFVRGDMLARMIVYYDNLQGLKSRGIDVSRMARKQRVSATPQAFPGDNCQPPVGWRG